MNRQNFISEHTRINRKFEVAFMPHIEKAIHKKVQATISKLRDGGVDAARSYLLTDLGNPEMEKIISRLYLIVGRKHAQLNYSRLLLERRQKKYLNGEIYMKGFGFNSKWADFILNYLKRFLTVKITFDIAATTRDALLRALTLMTMDGLSVDGMIEKLEDWPYERFQAARIVRTEVNRAANVGATAQANTSEFEQVKEWIAIHDNRTRGNPITGRKDHANHWALDKITIDEDDAFTDSRNGDRLMFPGDPNASAASTINCRCSIGYSFKRDSKGNLIPKRKSTVVLFPHQIVRPHTIVTI